MTDIRLIGIDIDGTLLNSSGRISDPTLAQMRRLHDLGVQLVLVTGRRYLTAADVCRQLNLPLLIASNNGASLRPLGGLTLYREELDEAATRQVCGEARRLGGFPWAFVEVNDAGDSIIYCEEPAAADSEGYAFDYLRAYFEAWRNYMRVVSDLSAEFIGASVEVVITVPPGHADPLAEALRARFGGLISVIQEHSRGYSQVDAAHPSVSKALPLKRLAEKNGLTPENVMAVGDNLNDLEMLEYAGYPVVMGNAHSGLLDLGYRIAPTNDKDGLAHVLAEIS